MQPSMSLSTKAEHSSSQSGVSGCSSDMSSCIASVGHPDLHQDDGELPLVMSSAPKQVGPVKGRYALRVLRASFKQPYGLTFDVAETTDGHLCAIMVTEDLPHMGIKRWDALLTVNGVKPQNIDQCRSIMQDVLSIVLVLQAEGTQSFGMPLPNPSVVSRALAEVDRLLLWVTKACVTNANSGEFKLALHRLSTKQKFGLAFDLSHSQKGGRYPIILVPRDLPHLALCRNDSVRLINGVRPRNREEVVRVLETATTVELTIRRPSFNEMVAA